MISHVCQRNLKVLGRQAGPGASVNQWWANFQSSNFWRGSFRQAAWLAIRQVEQSLGQIAETYLTQWKLRYVGRSPIPLFALTPNQSPALSVPMCLSRKHFKQSSRWVACANGCKTVPCVVCLRWRAEWFYLFARFWVRLCNGQCKPLEAWIVIWIYLNSFGVSMFCGYFWITSIWFILISFHSYCVLLCYIVQRNSCIFLQETCRQYTNVTCSKFYHLPWMPPGKLEIGGCWADWN